MPDLHSLPEGSHPKNAIRNNGPDHLTLERYKLRELAEGWPCYRDACEWENLVSIFHPDAYIYTTWTGRTHYAKFIEGSKAGMDKGAFIMHRIHGSTTDINPEATRAVTKMKATITQRFVLPQAGQEKDKTCEVDAESDCRFIFFWQKEPAGSQFAGEWRARFARHWYEKDKLVPVNPQKIPALSEEKLAKFPSGYRYLGYCQEETMGIQVLLDLPGHRREADNINGQKHDILYWQAKDWVEGKEIDI
ncbi:pathogenesis associated protein [Leptodontidium sp. 2 PMI_412]|nr:pathogenesis associated protein Pep2 [Leptodontidium sp. MPI-SDFR-AT-0119]KAH9203821.1 pathogenesis associated protein [Leptodontidium sp. 2 PMI_412]